VAALLSSADFPKSELPMSDSMIPVDREVDARGLNCPLPILRAKKALNELTSGQVLRILATDPGADRDFEAFSRQTGNALLGVEQHDDARAFYLQRR
jgi:tRNA 2-thiouridine synthesizing protein A